jgi:predicted house-cleaning noncanonical NTP pyrophosphatase (MazG superfamily)
MPRTFRLHKLVRDNIVAFNVDRGAKVEYETLEGDALQQALVAKIIEEANELQNAKISVEELADVQEIIDQIAENAGISQEDIAEAQEQKNAKNGAFKQGHFIETLTLPDDNEWVQYYASDSKRFPEL